MARSETTIISLEEAGRRFEEWRHNRSGKGRIPAKLCSVAVEVAGKEGLNRTARELHVAWDDLKRRVATSGKVPQQPGSPAFVELVAPRRRNRAYVLEWTPSIRLEMRWRSTLIRRNTTSSLRSPLSSSGLSSLPIEKASQIQDRLQRGEALGASGSGVLLQAIRSSQYHNARSFF
jgi:hypothetical protein